MSAAKDQYYADLTRKPPLIAPDAAGIPDELKAVPQWVLWVLTGRPGRWTKVPLQVNGRAASSTGPKTWAAFPDVWAAYTGRPGRFDGVGFVLAGGFVGIDLDDIRDPESGKITASWAAEMIAASGTYCDVSPSGLGVKLFGTGKWGRPKGLKRPHPSGVGEIELYASGRFFTVTGIPQGGVR